MTLGWHIGDLDRTRFFYKEGGGGGFHCMMRVYPGDGIGTVVMTNATGFGVRRLLDANRCPVHHVRAGPAAWTEHRVEGGPLRRFAMKRPRAPSAEGRAGTAAEGRAGPGVGIRRARALPQLSGHSEGVARSRLDSGLCVRPDRGRVAGRHQWASAAAHLREGADRDIETVEVADSWLAPDHRYFKLQDTQGDFYILRNDVANDRWELTWFRSGQWRWPHHT